jgi:hypothetical protein
MTAPGVTVTAFPVEGDNFRCKDGKVRGVQSVIVAHSGVIDVIYIDGTEETYPPEHVQEVTVK